MEYTYLRLMKLYDNVDLQSEPGSTIIMYKLTEIPKVDIIKIDFNCDDTENKLYDMIVSHYPNYQIHRKSYNLYLFDKEKFHDCKICYFDNQRQQLFTTEPYKLLAFEEAPNNFLLMNCDADKEEIIQKYYNLKPMKNIHTNYCNHCYIATRRINKTKQALKK